MILKLTLPVWHASGQSSSDLQGFPIANSIVAYSLEIIVFVKETVDRDREFSVATKVGFPRFAEHETR